MNAEPLSLEAIEKFVRDFKPSPNGRKFFISCLNGEIHVGGDLALLGRAFRKYLGFINIHREWVSLPLTEIGGIGIFEPRLSAAQKA